MTTFEDRLAQAQTQSGQLLQAIGSVIVGQEQVVQQVVWAIVAGGHVLLEGAPGLGKTLLIKTISQCLDLKFSRIQFTPDLMPSDITGTNILVTDDTGKRSFSLHRGPLFAQLVLADEINRATPKTQSALLEAMGEASCTIAGKIHQLEQPFAVLATENPIEMEGTYPLPEAQLDRFLLKVIVPNPSEAELTEILVRTTGQKGKAPEAVMSQSDVLGLRTLCRDVVVAPPVLNYVARLVGASAPDHPSATTMVRGALRYGAGVRGAQSLVLAAKAAALLAGRPNVALDDIKNVAKPVLRHRLIRSFEGEADGIEVDTIIDDLLEQVGRVPPAVERAAS